MIRQNSYESLFQESDEEESETDHTELNVSSSMQKEAITEMEKAVMIQIHSMDDPSQSITTQDENNIEIEYGNEKPVFPTSKVELYNKKFGLGMGLFYGRCFICGCAGHSQSFCPIKWCQKCHQYGHSQTNCNNPKGLKN